MKVSKSDTTKSSLPGRATKVKVNKKLDGFENAPFFKKKMAKANKILSIAPLPR
ncbi:MAG TPA: hypothetical protein VK563_07350 [Puia sp.]|nr:hypothetical protein [Puia sp.]